MGRSAERSSTAVAGVEVAPAVDAFLKKESLSDEFVVAARTARECFPEATRIRVTLDYDPEDEDAPPDVVLRVARAQSWADFRESNIRFYRSLSASGCGRLCLFLAVVSD